MLNALYYLFNPPSPPKFFPAFAPALYKIINILSHNRNILCLKLIWIIIFNFSSTQYCVDNSANYQDNKHQITLNNESKYIVIFI